MGMKYDKYYIDNIIKFVISLTNRVELSDIKFRFLLEKNKLESYTLYVYYQTYSYPVYFRMHFFENKCKLQIVNNRVHPKSIDIPIETYVSFSFFKKILFIIELVLTKLPFDDDQENSLKMLTRGINNVIRR